MSCVESVISQGILFWFRHIITDTKKDDKYRIKWMLHWSISKTTVERTPEFYTGIDDARVEILAKAVRKYGDAEISEQICVNIESGKQVRKCTGGENMMLEFAPNAYMLEYQDGAYLCNET